MTSFRRMKRGFYMQKSSYTLFCYLPVTLSLKCEKNHSPYMRFFLRQSAHFYQSSIDDEAGKYTDDKSPNRKMIFFHMAFIM